MILKSYRFFLCLIAVACTLTCTTPATGQHLESESIAGNLLPDAPSAQAPAQSGSVTILGTVTDTSGAVIAGATIALEAADPADDWHVQSGDAGNFRFAGVHPGTYRVTAIAKGFANWISAPVTVHGGEKVELPPIVLQVASASNSVNVSVSQHQIAEEQIKAEEQQRLFGILPAFYFSYVWHAAPLTTGQKFKLAWKDVTDPTAFVFPGAIATYEQARDNLRAYGQGTEGFSKRFGVNYADHFDSTMISRAILPTLLHQDPRYFVKGTGSFQSRALHAMSYPFIARNDNGHLQPNASVLLGEFASAELSNLYYPSSSQSHVTGSNLALSLAADSAGGLLLKFVFPKAMTHVPKHAPANAQLILREGTPISLVSIDNLSTEDAQRGKPVTFALARDIRVDGVLVVKAGSKAFGDVIGTAKPSKDGKSEEMPIQFLSLHVGDNQVPLRGSKGRVGDNEILYRLPVRAVAASGADTKIQIHAGTELTAYVATDISLHPAE
jgi:hypothetical protein